MAILYVLQGPDAGQAIDLTDSSVLLGRHSHQAPLTDYTVSRRHAELTREGDAWTITHLGSSNGTYVNGERISEATELHHGDQIKIGGTLLAFRGQMGVQGYGGPTATEDMVRVSGEGDAVDSSLLSAIQSSEESVIVAAPENAAAVRSWNVMYQLAEAAGVITTETEFLDRITDIILRSLIVDRLFILIRKSTGGKLEPAVVRYRSKAGRKHEQIKTSNAIIQQVIDTKVGVLCANANADERFVTDPNTASLESLALRSVICVPLTGHDEVIGVIHIDCPMARHTYSQDHLRLATAIGRVCGLALENQRLTEARMRNARLAATGETVAYLSHHIRNLLQGLRSGADIVDMGLNRDDSEKIRTGWRIVEHNLDRVFNLTTNMLTFSKDRLPRIELAQINNVIEDAVDLAKRHAEERGVMLLADLDDVPAIPTDVEGIHQVVFNLILNATDACPPETGRVLVKSRYDTDANVVSIRITDNGPGIDPDQMRGVFEPFNSSKGQGGTGLGLAAAKKIVDELQGEIRVKTAKDKGTRFEVRLAVMRTGATDLDKTHPTAR
ncbi:MAG: hypothetical protein DHS20C16_10760 [Phycisphaerae bacterium]|nr:MAG: hypothetical protein DHS20C16_10760 [Phycisphaerae bacterium]